MVGLSTIKRKVNEYWIIYWRNQLKNLLQIWSKPVALKHFNFQMPEGLTSVNFNKVWLK